MGGGTWENVGPENVGLWTGAVDPIFKEGGRIWADKGCGGFRAEGASQKKYNLNII